MVYQVIAFDGCKKNVFNPIKEGLLCEDVYLQPHHTIFLVRLFYEFYISQQYFYKLIFACRLPIRPFFTSSGINIYSKSCLKRGHLRDRVKLSALTRCPSKISIKPFSFITGILAYKKASLFIDKSKLRRVTKNV